MAKRYPCSTHSQDLVRTYELCDTAFMSSLRITVLSYIGQEDDIVEDFVRYTLQFADSMRIVSTAEGTTRDMLYRMQQRGLPIRVIDHRPAYHDQHEILSTVLIDAAQDADWILPLDADEFVTGDIRSALATVKTDRPYALAWRTYVPTAEDDRTELVIPRRIRHRRSEEIPQFTKIVIPTSIIGPAMTITQGNHAVIDENGERLEGQILQDVSLAHFPVRSSSQMQSKINRSWPAVARNPQKLPTEAVHWKTLHERFAGQEITPEMLTEIALRYAMSDDTPTPSLIDDPIS